MFEIRDYWRQVRTVEASLDADVYLMSIGDPLRGLVGGSVAQVGRESAARLIVEKKFRLATAAEITAHHEAARGKQEGLEAADRLRKGIGIFTLPAKKEGKK